MWVLGKTRDVYARSKSVNERPLAGKSVGGGREVDDNIKKKKKALDGLKKMKMTRQTLSQENGAQKFTSSFVA